MSARNPERKVQRHREALGLGDPPRRTSGDPPGSPAAWEQTQRRRPEEFRRAAGSRRGDGLHRGCKPGKPYFATRAWPARNATSWRGSTCHCSAVWHGWRGGPAKRGAWPRAQRPTAEPAIDCGGELAWAGEPFQRLRREIPGFYSRVTMKFHQQTAVAVDEEGGVPLSAASSPVENRKSPKSWIARRVAKVGSDTGIRTRILALRGLRPNP